MLTQLTTPIPLYTPKGEAWAIALIDYGPQWDLQWVTFIHATGECWTFRNQEIRQQENSTWGLPKPTEIERKIAKPAAVEKQTAESEDPGQDYPLMRPKPNGFSNH